MTILFVTGLLAKPIVEEQAKLCKFPTKVVVLNIPVASLMKPLYIAMNIKQYITPDIELVIVPGLVQGDISIIEKEIKVKTVRGPKNAADIAYILNNFGIEFLSKDVPADELIKDILRKKIDEEIFNINKNFELLKKDGNYKIRDLLFGVDFPVRIIAEITDIPYLNKEEIKEKVYYFNQSGADIIDLGMVANEPNSNKLKDIIPYIRNLTDRPLSIDSMNIEEINEAIKLGIDMVISLDRSLISKVLINENTFYVLVPLDFETKYFPKEPIERINLLKEMYNIAKNRGIKNIIFDAILDPPFSPSLYDSLVSYYLLRKEFPNIPILIGTGNLTELIDADTPGINALMTALASEINASFILSTEVSDKCKGVIKELSVASKMMFIAKKKKTYPKGLGYDLLFLKDKKIKDEVIENSSNAKVIECNEDLGFINDPMGWFRIYLDRKNKEIIVHRKPRYDSLESDIIIKGKKVENIYRTIAKLGIISRLDHASYLGSELQKAYIALKLGKTYIQDADLF